MLEINLFLAAVCGVLTLTALMVFAVRILRGAFPGACPSCKRRGLVRVGEVPPENSDETLPVQFACSSCRCCFQHAKVNNQWNRVEGAPCEALLKELDARML